MKEVDDVMTKRHEGQVRTSQFQRLGNAIMYNENCFFVERDLSINRDN